MAVRSIIEDKQDIQKELLKKLKLKNFLAVPKIEKVIINVSSKDLGENQKLFENMVEELKLISGQKPIVRRAKKSVAGFKIKEGDPVGFKVTLRGKKMNDFLFRLFNIVLPRARDFKGLPFKGFDKEGNYTLGLKEQTVFPEIAYDQIQLVHGLEITLRIRNSDPKKSRILLEIMGIPFLKTM